MILAGQLYITNFFLNFRICTTEKIKGDFISGPGLEIVLF